MVSIIFSNPHTNSKHHSQHPYSKLNYVDPKKAVVLEHVINFMLCHLKLEVIFHLKFSLSTAFMNA